MAMAKTNEYNGFGRFSPCILEPSQNNIVGQNTIIIRGDPDSAKNKNGVDKTIRQEDNNDTLLLNQRFNNKTNIRPKTRPITILGSFTLKVERPRSVIESF
jgi:hypothetical protein